MRLIFALAIAAAVAVAPNSIAEHRLGVAPIPANMIQEGKLYRVRADVYVTAANSTDTLTVKARLGTVTLTGAVVANSGAADVAVGDCVIVDFTITARSVGAPASLIASGGISAPGTPGTATLRSVYAALVPDTTVANILEITGTWSVANAGNAARLDVLEIFEITG